MTRPDKKTSNNGLDLNFTSPTAWSVGAFIVRSVAMMSHTDEQAWEISWKNKKDKFWGNFLDYFWGGITEAWRMSRKGMRGEHSPNQTRPETF